MAEGKILFTRNDGCWFIKMNGNIRYPIGRDFDHFINRMFREPTLQDVVIDLTDAEYLDSTNLGLLAKIANKMHEKFDRKVTLISTNANINYLLDSIGFYDIFIVISNPAATPGELHEITHLKAMEKQQAETMLEAHRLLMNMNEKNRNEFKDVVELLEKEV